jgi:hypothetical protein
MIRRLLPALALLSLLCAAPAGAEPPAERLAQLVRGIDVTGWFRFPVSADPAALRGYLSGAAMEQLRQAGFTAVRLSVQPEFLAGDAERRNLLVAAIRRLQRHRLAVVVAAHPAQWRLETSESDRAALIRFWDWLAPALRDLDPRLTFPELLNEPVFPAAPEAWRALQEQVLAAVRISLPDHTVVLTGADWGSVAGLLALRPAADPNVIYSVHFYEPAELTSLAAYRPGLDRAALARLPFPATDRDACFRTAQPADAATAALMRFYCGLRWDAARVGARIDAAAAWGRRNRAAVLLGEFGASAALNGESRLAWVRAVRTRSEAAGIGWMLWGYDDVMGFALPRPPPRTPVLDPDLLATLGLKPPMPVQVARPGGVVRQPAAETKSPRHAAGGK